MWSGRFRKPLDPQFEQWQRSFPFDRKLLLYEVAASSAHAHALHQAGVLTAQERDSILEGLGEIYRKGPGGLDDPTTEDVHHFVEKELVALIGDSGIARLAAAIAGNSC